MTPGLRIEPGPHWWEASALTTTPPLLPQLVNYITIHLVNFTVVVANSKAFSPLATTHFSLVKCDSYL